MTGNHSIMHLAEHLLATPLDQLGMRERQVIERAVRRHREPLPRGSLPEERLSLGERLADRVADKFALVRSVLGDAPRYHVVSQWPLQNAPGTNVKTVQASGGTE